MASENQDHNSIDPALQQDQREHELQNPGTYRSLQHSPFAAPTQPTAQHQQLPAIQALAQQQQQQQQQAQQAQQVQQQSSPQTPQHPAAYYPAFTGTTPLQPTPASGHYEPAQPGQDDSADSPGGLDGSGNDPKRSRACESCRNLKVKCERDGDSPQCKRCARAKRPCVTTEPSRKRVKRDNRVAELEKRIEYYISQQNTGANANPNQTSAFSSALPGGAQDVGGFPGRLLETSTRLAYDSSYRHSHIIERVNAVIPQHIQEEMFAYYVHRMMTHMPSVWFPADYSSEQIRRQKPLLYLSVVLAASVGRFDTAIQANLNQDLLIYIAHDMIIMPKKDIEMIQVILVSVTWYRPPADFAKLNFWVLIQCALGIASELDLGKRVNRYYVSPQSQLASSIEARRSYMGIYFLASNMAMALRRIPMMRWGAYIEESVDLLEKSPQAAPTDAILCQHVRLQHMLEDIGETFSMNDPEASIDAYDPKIQQAMVDYSKRLDDWISECPPSILGPGLSLSANIVRLYANEVALHETHANAEDYKAPFGEEALRIATAENKDKTITPVHRDAIVQCLRSCHGAIDEFLKFELEDVKALPIFYFVRISYCFVVLMKMHFATITDGSALNKTVDRSELRVHETLRNLWRCFNAVNETGAFRPSNKLLSVISKLMDWFADHETARPGTAGADAQQDSAISANNLHILSEAATGQNAPNPNSAPTPGGAADLAGYSGIPVSNFSADYSETFPYSAAMILGATEPSQAQSAQQQSWSASTRPHDLSALAATSNDFDAPMGASFGGFSNSVPQTNGQALDNNSYRGFDAPATTSGQTNWSFKNEG